MRSFSPDVLLPIYGLGIIGAFLQVVGAQWDVSWHILGIVETFFQPAHFILYAGIGSVAIATFFGLRYALKYEHLKFKQVVSYVFGRTKNNQPYSKLLTGVRIAAIGVGLQLLAGPFDGYWHSLHGFDPILFTPAHSMLIVGLLFDGVGMFLGTARLLQAQHEGFRIAPSTKILPFLAVIGLASVWMILNFVGYWITDTTGMAVTFGFCSIDQFRLLGRSSCGFYENDVSFLFSDLVSAAIFAAAGVFAFLTARTLFVRKGIFTSAALITAAVYSTFALGFMAYIVAFANPPGTFYLTNPTPDQGIRAAMFIPLYLLSLAPVLAFDFLSRPGMARQTMIGLSAVLGPFAAFLDGRYASTLADSLVSSPVETLVLIVPPEIIGGILAAILFQRLKAKLTVAPVRPIAAELVARQRASH